MEKLKINNFKQENKLPSNIEAEQALIGSILVNNDIIDEISNIVDHKNFYDPLHSKIYNLIENLHSKHLVLCEGELDALLLIRHGIPAITVTGGAGAGSEPLAVELKSAGVEQVTLAMDHDLAGIQGADKYRDGLEKQGIGVKTIMWPSEREKGWDITDELANNGAESLRSILDAASQSICPAHGPFKLLTTADVLKHTVEIEWQVDQIMAKGSVINSALSVSCALDRSQSPVKVIRLSANNSRIVRTASMQPGSCRSTTNKHASVGCNALAIHDTGCSRVSGGKSTS